MSTAINSPLHLINGVSEVFVRVWQKSTDALFVYITAGSRENGKHHG